MEFKPARRDNNLAVCETDDELLVYDLITDKAYCLNQTSVFIRQLCDGKHSVAEISRKMSRQYMSAINEEFVWLALDELKKDNLLSNDEQIEKTFAGINRRELIKKAGYATFVALPVIISISAPRAINAQSAPTVCFAPGNPCQPRGCVLYTGGGVGQETSCEISPAPAQHCCSGTGTSVPFRGGIACTCN